MFCFWFSCCNFRQFAELGSALPTAILDTQMLREYKKETMSDCPQNERGGMTTQCDNNVHTTVKTCLNPNIQNAQRADDEANTM